MNFFEKLSRNQISRIAGLIYLAMAITGVVGLLVVPSQIFVVGDAAKTAANIADNEFLFRVGIFFQILTQVIFIFLVLSLLALFKGVDKKLSKLMFVLVVAAVPIAFVLTFFEVGALILLSGADYLNAFTSDQLNALAMALLELYNQGVFIIGIFWGLWLLPFGLLVYKSGFLPKWLGILLIINGFAYIADAKIFLLYPDIHESATNFLALPIALGELATVLYFLIRGAKEQKT